MKVLSFLEYQDLTFQHPQEYFDEFESILSQFIKWDEDSDGEWDILKFYSQPFKPEMIIELFQGWHIDYDEGVWQNKKYPEKAIEFIINDDDSEWMLIDYLTSIRKPRTLDEFITDCQRAGIELEWRGKKMDKMDAYTHLKYIRNKARKEPVINAKFIEALDIALTELSKVVVKEIKKEEKMSRNLYEDIPKLKDALNKVDEIHDNKSIYYIGENLVNHRYYITTDKIENPVHIIFPNRDYSKDEKINLNVNKITTNQQAEIMLAAEYDSDGRCINIEGRSKLYEDNSWCSAGSPIWDWYNYEYRVKPEPIYKPYTTADPSWVGKTVKQKLYNDYYMITGVRDELDKSCVWIHNFLAGLTLKQLFNDYIWADGNPCGEVVNDNK